MKTSRKLRGPKLKFVSAADQVPTFHFAEESYPSGKPYWRVDELATEIASLSGARVVQSPICLEYATNENPVQGLDCSDSRERLGWRPQMSLEQGLDDVIASYRAKDSKMVTEILRRNIESTVGWLKHSPFDLMSIFRNRKVMVTGASGYKGANIIALLNEYGAEVVAGIHQAAHPNSAYSLLGTSGRVHEVLCDVANRVQVMELITRHRPEFIFNLGAIATVPVALDNPVRAFEINAGGPLNLLDACRRVRGIKGFLQVSTDHVFGSLQLTDIPVKVDHPVGFCGPYDTSKACGELGVRAMVKTYGDDLPKVCITRAANVFGPADTAHRRVIPNFVRAAVDNGEICLTCRANGRQFIGVTDCVAGYLLAMASLFDTPSSTFGPG